MAYTPKVQRQIILDNLQLQTRDVSTTLEARLSHISDLARVLCATLDEFTPKQIAGLGEKQSLQVRDSVHREALPQNRGYLEEALTALTLADKVKLCEYLALYLKEKDPHISPQMFLPQGESVTRIAYMRNNLTDEAFDMFALDLEAPTALYCEDYEASCVAVAVGDASACILPYRDVSGTKARMTQGYLTTYNLCICALYTVYNGEDEGVEYALCKRGAMVPQGGYQLFFRLTSVTPYEVEELQGAMRLFGLTTKEVTYMGEKLFICLAGEVPLLPPLLWLTLFHPRVYIEGLTKETVKETTNDLFL